ncbi:MAG: carboxypeptidase, partial [Deinococcota bacterium]
EVHGQLEGRAYKSSSPGRRELADASDDRLKLEWLIHAPAGGEINVTVRHERAGKVELSFKLE